VDNGAFAPCPSLLAVSHEDGHAGAYHRARWPRALTLPTIQCLRGSIPNRETGNVGALQRSAYRLGLIAVEAGKAGTE
jgi:hypothetical protein